MRKHNNNNKFHKKNKRDKNNVAGEAIYPGNNKFSDFKGLKEIGNPYQNTKTALYLYFDPQNIKDFHKADESVQAKFFNLVDQGISLCRDKKQSGIKNINDIQLKLSTTINNEPYNGKISHEMKVLSIPHRLGLYSLKPKSGNGPTILVASSYVENGFKKEKNKKLINGHFNACPLSMTNKSENKNTRMKKNPPTDLLNKHGIFSARNRQSPKVAKETVSVNRSRSKCVVV